MTRQIKALLALLIFFLIGLGVVFYLLGVLPKLLVDNQENRSSRPNCLLKNEIAEYPLSEKYHPEAQIPQIPVIIYVKDRETEKEKFNFRIDDVDPKHYHPLELHECGVYVVRKFNYDPGKSEQKPGFRAEIWKYQYNGEGNALLLLTEKDNKGVFKAYFSYDFRIDPTETYLVLERSYLGNPDYALVIKNLNTQEDVFVLPLKEIVDKYPELKGSIGFNEWTKDGRYFWGNVFDRADVLTFLRIERDTWKYEIFKVPSGTMGGDALNTELGYVTYDDGPPWTGDLDFAKMYQEEWEKKGKIVSFYLYNLFTEEQIVLATTTDTIWFFQPKWISDTELEYELPTGEKKIYMVGE